MLPVLGHGDQTFRVIRFILLRIVGIDRENLPGIIGNHSEDWRPVYGGEIQFRLRVLRHSKLILQELVEPQCDTGMVLRVTGMIPVRHAGDSPVFRFESLDGCRQIVDFPVKVIGRHHEENRTGDPLVVDTVGQKLGRFVGGEASA